MKNNRRNRKPNFSELINSITVLCRSEKASALFCDWTSHAVGSYEDAQTYLAQLIAQCDNPVIRMLAKQAMAAR